MSGVIDKNTLNTLLESIGGDQEFLQELIETFFEDAPEQLRALDSSFTSGDAETFRRAAHSLKSNSASFGAMELSGLSKQLEDIGKSGELSSAQDLLEKLKSAYIEVKNELSKHLG